MYFAKHKAFTIAEILITLLVIGFLFSLYSSNLNNSYQKNVTQTTLSDSMKNFNEALLHYSSNNKKCNGSLTCTGLFSQNNDHSAASQMLPAFVSADSKNNNCWAGNISNPDKNLNNYSCIIDIKKVIFATQNVANNTNCKTDLLNPAAGIGKHKLQKSCGYLYIDVNGTKAPNAFGKDVFIFVITDNAPSYLYPVGGKFWQDATNFNGIKECMQDGDGRGCAGKIIEDNMKINY
ncbi:MAG: type II secretion system GspH family protein [Candidatus Gastranaerophilales bacterium]|nr:type II secretion system GspH family protein [Candidatus Gastranaerophilales bacterium]